MHVCGRIFLETSLIRGELILDHMQLFKLKIYHFSDFYSRDSLKLYYT